MPIPVLIVEDESLIRWSLRQKFEQIGYEVTEADRRDEPLSSLGIDILRKLREMDKEVVVIMMTAYSKIVNGVEAIKLGAFDYLPKRFQMDLLLLTVKAQQRDRTARTPRPASPSGARSGEQ